MLKRGAALGAALGVLLLLQAAATPAAALGAAGGLSFGTRCLASEAGLTAAETAPGVWTFEVVSVDLCRPPFDGVFEGPFSLAGGGCVQGVLEFSAYRICFTPTSVAPPVYGYGAHFCNTNTPGTCPQEVGEVTLVGAAY